MGGSKVAVMVIAMVLFNCPILHSLSLGLCNTSLVMGNGTHSRLEEGLKEVIALFRSDIVDDNMIWQDDDLPSRATPRFTQPRRVCQHDTWHALAAIGFPESLLSVINGFLKIGGQ